MLQTTIFLSVLWAYVNYIYITFFILQPLILDFYENTKDTKDLCAAHVEAEKRFNE